MNADVENKPDLMAELAEVVRLSDAATAGEWRTEYRKSPRGYGQEVFDSSGATIAELAWHAVPKNETTTTTDREPNAKLIAAAVNFLRTHHAELEAMVRDAEAYRKLVAGIDAEQLVAASEKHGDAMVVLRDAERYRWLRDIGTDDNDWTVLQKMESGLHQVHMFPDRLDEALDHAMHNSAREASKP